jgi:hypothetical protein
MASHDGMKFFTTGLLLTPWIRRFVTRLVACVAVGTLRVTDHSFAKCLHFLYRCRLGHWTFKVASKIVSTTMMALSGLCNRRIKKIALCIDALKRAYKFGACFKTFLSFVALSTACFDLLPSSLLRQVFIE